MTLNKRPPIIHGMNFVFGREVLKGTAGQVRQRIENAFDVLRDYAHRNRDYLAQYSHGSDVAVVYDTETTERFIPKDSEKSREFFVNYTQSQPQSVVALIPFNFFNQRAEAAA